MVTFFSIAVDAVAYGMALFIICIGLSLMMGLMRVVNLAHGAFAMIGGYLASYATMQLGFGYFAGIALAVLGTALIALPLEPLLYRRIYGKPELMQVLMTVGIAFAAIGIVNYLMGPTLKTIPLPPILATPVDLGFRSIAGHRLFVIASGIVVVAALWIAIEYTTLGVKLRAAIEKPDMARALGVRTNAYFLGCYVVATALAAFGGAVGAEFLPIEPFYALRYIVTFLVVVSVGGAGSILGSLFACLLLGAIDVTGRYLVPDFGNFFFYLCVIVVIFAYPNGLMGRAR
jgi:branched-chain amino acid transport system permease protein